MSRYRTISELKQNLRKGGKRRLNCFAAMGTPCIYGNFVFQSRDYSAYIAHPEHITFFII
jgi:hypothetical protein